MKDVGKRKMGARVCCCATVGGKSWPAVAENWLIFHVVLRRVGGICPSACLSESERENKTVCQSVSREQTSCQEHHMLNPKLLLISDVFQSNVLYFGMSPVLTQIDSDAERSKQSNNNKSHQFFSWFYAKNMLMFAIKLKISQWQLFLIFGSHKQKKEDNHR